MPTYYDSRNQPYVLTKRLGGGGEGAVYSCEGDSQIVAKIYHEPVTEEKADKLRWMAGHQDERLSKVAAWVIDVLLDEPGGEVVGFLMPNVRAKEIHELYSLKSRRVYFPEATWHFLVHTAANVARAFYSLHKNGHLMGDVNHGNCVVLADGTVKLIDCDSYGIKTERRRYPCEVGVTTHLAPELQRTNLRRAERLEKHDNFGLAVIIFQLLFLGRHPFSGNYRGDDDKSLEDCIRENLFAYGADANSRGIEQPPGTLSLSAVSPAVASLFERAFTSNESRPTPREWVEALEDLGDSLEQCSLHPGHLFYEKSLLCPWCEIESQTGLTLFPFVVTDSRLKAKHKKHFDVVTVENLIASFNINPNLPVRLSENLALTDVFPESVIMQENTEQRIQKLVVCGVYFGCLLLAYLMFGNFCAFVLGFVALCVLYNVFKDNGKTLRGDEKGRLTELQSKWNAIETQWTTLAAAPDLERDLVQIREKLDAYRELQTVAAREEARVGEPGENPAPAAEMKVGKPVKTRLKDEYAEKSSLLEMEISGLLSNLRAGSVKLRGHRQNLLSQSKKLSRELLQSRRNVDYLGSNVPMGLLLIFIALGTPVLVSLLPNPDANRSVAPPGYTSTYTKAKSPINPPLTERETAIPDEKITDSEIAALPPAERAAIISELIKMSDASSVYAETVGYDIAEKKLKFALRFDDKNTVVINKLGNVFYEQAKYEQALVYFNRSKKIDDTDGVNFLIGMTYLNMQKYAAARNVFVKLTTGGMPTNESFYNLGMAYQGLGNHKAAVEAFREAFSINTGDVDSIYQLGISLNKLGDQESVRVYYQMLLQKDVKRAEKLKKAVGKSVDLEAPPDDSRTIIEAPVQAPPRPLLQRAIR